MGEDQVMASMLGLLSGMALHTVSDLPFNFWLSETGEAVMSLEQSFDIIEKELSISREKNCNRTDSTKSRGRNVIEEKVERENGQTDGRIKDSLRENSEVNSERRQVGSELVGTGCSNQNKATRNLQNVEYLLQLSKSKKNSYF